MLHKLTPSERLELLADLQTKKLVTARTVGDYTIYKYSRKVFWEALWNRSPVLLEARGLVLDSAGEVVVWPFTKVFNYLENDTKFPRDEQVTYVEKKNGFMGVVTVVPDGNGYKTLVTTSGSLESDFVELAKKHLGQNFLDMLATSSHCGFTFIFEICSPEDPHIIEEEQEVYLIGARYVPTGEMTPELFLDSWVESFQRAGAMHVHRPEVFTGRFSDVVKLSKTCKHEGYMVYDSNGKCLKIKSPYYLGKKFLSRSKKTEAIWTDPKKAKKMLDEEFYSLIEDLPKKVTLAEWQAMEQIARLRLVESLLP